MKAGGRSQKSEAQSAVLGSPQVKQLCKRVRSQKLANCNNLPIFLFPCFLQSVVNLLASIKPETDLIVD